MKKIIFVLLVCVSYTTVKSQCGGFVSGGDFIPMSSIGSTSTNEAMSRNLEIMSRTGEANRNNYCNTTISTSTNNPITYDYNTTANTNRTRNHNNDNYDYSKEKMNSTPKTVTITKHEIVSSNRVISNPYSFPENTYFVPNDKLNTSFTAIVKDNIHNITYVYTNVGIISSIQIY